MACLCFTQEEEKRCLKPKDDVHISNGSENNVRIMNFNFFHFFFSPLNFNGYFY